jgi:MSHA biogenesis protein MshI
LGDGVLFALLKKKPRNKGVTGLSVSSAGIAIARVLRGEGQSPVLDICDFMPLDAHADRKGALARLVAKHGLQGAHTIDVLQPELHSLLLIEAPDVQPAELKAAVRWRIKDLIDFHIDDAVIDVFEVPDQGGPGRARLMYAVAVRASHINEQVDTLKGSGLELDVIDIPELALRNITSLLEQDVRGMALLSFTDNSGLITLTCQGKLYLSRNLDIGIKQLGSDDPDMQSQALERIALEVQRSLDYYESHFSQSPVSQLVIAPMQHDVPGMLPHLSANLGIAVSMLDVNDIMDCSEPLPTDLQSQCLTAIGAALRVEQKAL